MTALEVSPAVERGAAAILNLIFPSREEQARAALAAGLDVEEMGRALWGTDVAMGIEYGEWTDIPESERDIYRNMARAIRTMILGEGQ